MLENLNTNVNGGRATITAHLGPERRKEAVQGSDYVVNAVQVGGYEPSTVIDFEVPKRYGLRQTIGDTLGIGGIFRALRTIPVVLEFARDVEAAAPGAWFLNYVNPMAMITGAVLRATGVRAVGLCHSVQGCAEGLLKLVGLQDDVRRLRWKVAGMNHQAWLLEVADGARDLYPEIKRRARGMLAEARRPGGKKLRDMVRLEIMLRFGYYATESSEHLAEYLPYFIKSARPELVREYEIPLDEYPRRCRRNIEKWAEQRERLVADAGLTHSRTKEYASYIMEAMETGRPFEIGGNVLNDGLITNLPRKAVVEVPCLVDRTGVSPCVVGELPEQCAALNRTSVNVQLMTIEAALTRRREAVYQAALLDPHTAAELTLDEIVRLCDDLIEAHGAMLPAFE
jgi:alpha-galactosidase